MRDQHKEGYGSRRNRITLSQFISDNKTSHSCWLEFAPHTKEVVNTFSLVREQIQCFRSCVVFSFFVVFRMSPSLGLVHRYMHL